MFWDNAVLWYLPGDAASPLPLYLHGVQTATSWKMTSTWGRPRAKRTGATRKTAEAESTSVATTIITITITAITRTGKSPTATAKTRTVVTETITTLATRKPTWKTSTSTSGKCRYPSLAKPEWPHPSTVPMGQSRECTGEDLNGRLSSQTYPDWAVGTRLTGVCALRACWSPFCAILHCIFPLAAFIPWCGVIDYLPGSQPLLGFYRSICRICVLWFGCHCLVRNLWCVFKLLLTGL